MPQTHHPKQVARSGAVYTIALVFQKILSFAYFSVLAAALGPQALGTYIFALSFAAFFSLVADFGIVPLAIRTFSQNPSRQKEYFRTFFTIRMFLAALSLAVLHGVSFALGYGSELRVLLAITSVIMVMDAFTAYFYTIFRSQQNLFYEALGTIAFQIIIFTVGLFVISKTHDLRALLLVIGAGSLFHIVFSSILIRRKAKIDFRFRIKPGIARQWMARAMPFFLAAGFIKAYNTIDSILLKNLVGDEAVGLYAIPAKIVFTFPFVALAVTAAVYPAMSHYAVESRERLQSIFSRTLQLLLTISLPIAVGIYLLAGPIVMRIWPEFSASIPALQILIWAVVFLYVEFPFGSLLNATGNERRNTVNRGIQLTVFVALNLILIPVYGFLGAVYAALSCSVLIVFLGWVRAREIVPVFTARFVASFLKLAIASGLMGTAVHYFKDEYSFLIIIPVAAVLYGMLLLLLRAYTAEDWQWLKSVVSH
ncbi:MAG: flippase [Parcubacteria group bacterium]|nr:flippase [Parcubacteria group bacterium]